MDFINKGGVDGMNNPFETNEEICGTCIYHVYDEEANAFVCDCSRSPFEGADTPYRFSCNDYEDRY